MQPCYCVRTVFSSCRPALVRKRTYARARRLALCAVPPSPLDDDVPVLAGNTTGRRRRHAPEGTHAPTYGLVGPTGRLLE